MNKNSVVLAFAAHPDDVELAACGTLLAMKDQGAMIGIVDLTKGELGTRGDAITRKAEAAASSKILDLNFRENLDLGDGFFEINQKNLLIVIGILRKYKPEIVLANSVQDRHPDHGRAAELIQRACFLSGLPKIKTTHNGEEQSAHRPKQVYHYIQDMDLEPDLVFDISAYFSKKRQAIACFATQFSVGSEPQSGPTTPISTPEFWNFIEARARNFGRMIGVEFAEAFNTQRPPGSNNLFELL